MNASRNLQATHSWNGHRRACSQTGVAISPDDDMGRSVGGVQIAPFRYRPSCQDCYRLRVADIPGLVEGAHQNRGLGHEFLRHIARTRALVYVVDAAGTEDRSPADDLANLVKEVHLYDEALAQKAAFVVANKVDLPGESQSCLWV